MTDKERKIFKWIYSIGCSSFTDKIISYLVNDCHMEEIRDYYCNDIVYYAIDNFGGNDIKIAFSELWAVSKNINLWTLLIGFGICDDNLAPLKKIVYKYFNTLEKLRKVNYRQLVELGIDKLDAIYFIDNLQYNFNEIDAVLNTNRVTIKPVNEDDNG